MLGLSGVLLIMCQADEFVREECSDGLEVADCARAMVVSSLSPTISTYPLSTRANRCSPPHRLARHRVCVHFFRLCVYGYIGNARTSVAGWCFMPGRAALPRRTAPPLDTAFPITQLTPREQEVAALVAQGLTNKQIAGALVVCDATAERHVANILSKLGLRSRVEIAIRSLERECH